MISFWSLYKNNHSINDGNIIADVKKSEVRQLYKNDEGVDKSNYQPICIMSNVSKIYERCLYCQLCDYFDQNICPKYQCGFRKSISTQQALLVMIEKMKTVRDNKPFFAAILTDSLKAFDCICHDLLSTKLNAYGLNQNALKLIYDYFCDIS